MKRVCTLAAIVTIAASGFMLTSTSAQASEISPGRAVVRIDSPTASVKSTGTKTYRIVLKKNASGQWMGERTVNSGKKKSLVRDLTASQFVTNWTTFKYSSSGVWATLAWGKGADYTTAVIKLAKPKVTSKGVVFDFTSDSAIPERLADASINVQRAPSGKRSTLTSYTVSGDLTISFEIINTYEVKARIYNKGNNNTCWGTKDIKADSSATLQPEETDVSVGSNTCANIHYEDSKTWNDGEVFTWGVQIDWPFCNNDSSETGSASMNLSVLPNGEEDSFSYVQAVTLNC